tara:strand:+ start:151 stop:438 length:288 start_codon:yes stop_codon:yes gene_type:complete
MNKTNVTRIEIAKNLSIHTGFSKEISKKLIDDLIDILTNNLVKRNLHIKNIGTFKIIKKNERVGRNPKTKENYIIKERNSISFIASKNLLNIINK